MKDEKNDGAALLPADALASQSGTETLPDREICICAAIKLPDGRVFNGHRHDGAIEYAGKTLRHESKAIMASQEWIDSWVRSLIAESVQGFTTSVARFVDRYEGMRLQRAAGKTSAQYGDLRGDMLFSEDLY